MLDKKIKMTSLLILSLLYTLNISLLKSDNLNDCIKKAISKEISLNKILTLCRENINPINVYSNNYEVNKGDPGSEYISTNKTDKIINELIEEGELSKAGRLAIRQDEEKTNEIFVLKNESNLLVFLTDYIKRNNHNILSSDRLKFVWLWSE